MGDCSEREGRPALGQRGGGAGPVWEEEFDDALGSPHDGCLLYSPHCVCVCTVFKQQLGRVGEAEFYGDS